jgi:hypothetical protein
VPSGSGGWSRTARPETSCRCPASGGAVRGLPRQGATARSAAAATRSGRRRAGARAPAAPRSRTRCSSGRSGRSGEDRARSIAGSRGVARPAVVSTTGWRSRPAPGGSTQDSPQARVQVFGQRRGRSVGRGWEGPHDELRAGGKGRQAVPDEMAQPPGDPMSGDRAAHGAAHHEASARGSVGVRRVRGGEVYDEPRTSRAETTSHGGGELVPMGEPRAGRQHRRGPAQAESRSRPLRRRPATMARPARVRIRSRKPCVRARRRLFGWKVRLPLLTSQLSRSTARCGAGRRSALGLDGYARFFRADTHRGTPDTGRKPRVNHQRTQRRESRSNRPPRLSHAAGRRLWPCRVPLACAFARCGAGGSSRPRTARARSPRDLSAGPARTVLRTGVDRSGDGSRSDDVSRPSPRPSAVITRGGRTWSTSPLTWSTCGTW